MSDRDPLLAGRRLLILDDEPLLAHDLADLLESHGAHIVGPFHDLESAHAEACDPATGCDGALLDIQIGDKLVWPLAERLEAENKPYLFVSAYCGANSLPEKFAHRPCLPKPVDREELRQTLTRLFA